MVYLIFKLQKNELKYLLQVNDLPLYLDIANTHLVGNRILIIMKKI